MLGQTWNGRDLDRRLLVPLDRPDCDSVATALQAKLTDAVIESAAARLPPSYIPLDSARLANALKQRRDELPEAAQRYYRHLAGEVDMHGTDQNEVAEVQRVDGRFTEVTLAAGRRERRGGGAVLPPPVRPRARPRKSVCTCTAATTRCG